MEMTIDEAISWLVSIAEHAGEDDISIYDEDAVAIEIAMNIMRKYQKIEEIVLKYQNEYDRRILGEDAWDEVRKVIMYGNDKSRSD